MGLDTSHNCWHGSYTAFGLWRSEIARVIGISLDSMEGFSESPSAIPWENLVPNPIHELLNHSDCEGEIPWESCGRIADSLEAIIPLLPEQDPSYREKTQQFINGLRAAFLAQENVEFH